MAGIMRSGFMSRRFRIFGVLSAAAALTFGVVVAACNDDPVIQPPSCTPGACTCDQDPTQPACKGYNDRGDGGVDTSDATPVDAFVPDTGTTDDAGDADTDADAGDDGGDE